jgi:hypothetical protein
VQSVFIPDLCSDFRPTLDLKRVIVWQRAAFFACQLFGGTFAFA